MSRILVCGDSYCVTDPLYPNLHWTEKILNSSSEYKIYNLAYGGCSNALIVLQLLQGLKFDPDFVILSFTGNARYEIDNDINALPSSIDYEELSDYIKRRYATNLNFTAVDDTKRKIIDQYRTIGVSGNFEKLKNYFFISFCLQTLLSRQINFCYSLGGFEYQQDHTALIRDNFLENLILNFQSQELPINLWYHGQESRPCFHVKSDQVQTLFANECIARIKNHG